MTLGPGSSKARAVSAGALALTVVALAAPALGRAGCLGVPWSPHPPRATCGQF